jgi:tetratricopeptide (TPR) repeat protein
MTNWPLAASIPKSEDASGESSCGTLAVAASLIAVIVYLPALDLRYVGYDDALYIQQNPHIAKLDLETIRWAFFPDEFIANNYHPLTWLSHATDMAVFGLDNPWGHHLVNVLLHALNSGLVVILAYRLLGWRSAGRPDCLLAGPPLRLAAALTGIGFAVHPLHVESVAWLAERKDVLCGFFYLVTTITYLSYVRRFESGRTWRLRYGLVVLAALSAYLAKPMAVTLPFVLSLLDAYPLRRFRALSDWRTNALLLLEKLPVVAMTVADCMVALPAQGRAVAGLNYSIPSRLFTAIWAYVFYLHKFLWPTALTPLYYLKFNFVFDPGSFAEGIERLGEILRTHPEVLVAASILSCLVTTAALSVRRWPGPVAALVAYMVTLLPVIGIVQVGVQSAADRYMYLPSIPLLLIAAAAFGCVYGTAGRAKNDVIQRLVAIAVAATVSVGWSLATVRQVPIWTDAYTLWSACYRRVLDNEGPSQNPEVTYRYAYVLIQRGGADDVVEAQSLLNGLLNWDGSRTGFKRPDVLGQLSRIFVREGRYDEAKRYAAESLAAMSPEERKWQDDQFVVLGLVALHENDPAEAERQFRQALAARPRFPEAYYDLALAQSRQGHTEDALESLRAAAEQGCLEIHTREHLIANLRPDPDLGNLSTSKAYRQLLDCGGPQAIGRSR